MRTWIVLLPDKRKFVVKAKSVSVTDTAITFTIEDEAVATFFTSQVVGFHLKGAL